MNPTSSSIAPKSRDRWATFVARSTGILLSQTNLCTKTMVLRRCIRLGWVQLARLQRVAVGLAGADAHRLLDRRDKDFAVADLAGLGGGADRLDHAVAELTEPTQAGYTSS